MPSIRLATAADIPLILYLIRALAEYEREPDAVQTTEADLLRDGFGAQPCFECLIAENEQDKAVGFALYFYNYSTWRGRQGIHLEDLFVLPEFRGQGIGKALLARVGARAAEQGCVRLQWDVLAWNQTAIDFYQSLGARFLDEWRIMRMSDEGIHGLANLARETEPAH
ncbi:MAG: GNAT family N-acetyltransferase [Acidobacteriaceae bacterium]